MPSYSGYRAISSYKPDSLPSRGAEVFNVSFGDIPTMIKEKMNDSILSCTVNYSMDMATEITLKIIDRDFNPPGAKRKLSDTGGYAPNSFAEGNYFNIGRDVTYMSRQIAKSEFNDDTKRAAITFQPVLMEVADISVDQEQSVSPIWTVKCRPKAVQQMKRDRKPEVIEGDGADYVRAACAKYGIKCVAENTDKKKKITKASGDNEGDSTWDVLGNLAQQAKFKMFECDGTLYFASMKWLMYKWGPDAITYVAQVKNEKTGRLEDKVVTRRYIPLMPGEMGADYQTQKMPSMNRSDNDVMEGKGSATIDRTNGVGIRPGMTVFVGGIPTFVGYYLVTAVDYEERSPNPVGIQFSTPERKPKEKKIYLPVGPMYDQTGDPIGPDVLIPYQIRRQTGAVKTTGGKPPTP